MATGDQIQAAAHAFENMSDDEATAWLAAGDYATVAGIPLSEAATEKFAQLASGEEVEGFGFDFSLFSQDAVQMPEANVAGKASPNLFKACCKGEHLKKVVLSL
jgi:hypothetical protein